MRSLLRVRVLTALLFSTGAVALAPACSGPQFTASDADASAGGAAGTGGGAAGAGATCATGQTQCPTGQCVQSDDPAFGCGAADCAPCSLPNATAGCAAGACSIASCATGHGDCDGDPSNGCETLLSSTSHCGSCATKCPGGQVCSKGTCQASCSSGETLCGDTCANTQTDPENCGGCGKTCAPAPNSVPVCESGHCALQCNTSFANCDNDAGNGCETSLVTTSNCGSCGTVCPTGANAIATCTATGCGLQCQPGFADCNGNPADGCETDVSSDKNHCGSCTKACSGVAPACCSSTCVDLDSDKANCGACQNACVAGPDVGQTLCVTGKCKDVCSAAKFDCNGNCADGCECSGACTGCNAFVVCN